MSAADLCLGRGIVTLDAADIGLVSSLVLRHEVESVGIATLDPNRIGGSVEIARRTRVFLDFSIHELTPANRALIWNLIGTAAPVRLEWFGKNALDPLCPDDAYMFEVPKLVLLPAPATQFLPESLNEIETQITGEALRDAGSTSWYSCSLGP